MSYYWFNRQEILQKAKEEYSKEKEYYLQNKEAIKEKTIETCHKKKKTNQRVSEEKTTGIGSIQKGSTKE